MHHLSLSFDKLCNTLQTYNASGRLMRRLYSAVNFKLKQAQRNRSQNTTREIKQRWSEKRGGSWREIRLHGNMKERASKKKSLNRGVVDFRGFICMEILMNRFQKTWL